ncbi:MAG: glycosyl transferase, family 2 [Pseudomonadota bacterium]
MEAVHLAREQGRLSVCQLSLIDNTPQSSDKHLLFDGVVAALETENIAVSLRAGQGNIGFGRAHNMAIRASKCDLHLVLNPDCVLSPMALCKALYSMHTHPECALLAAQGVNAEGDETPMAFRYPKIGILLCRFLNLHRFFPNMMRAYEYRGEIKQLMPVVRSSGAFMLMQTQTLQAIGAFDEHFFLHFEDIDLSLRIGRYGKILCDPEVRVTHYGGRASGGGGHTLALVKSAFIFYNLYGWFKYKERK